MRASTRISATWGIPALVAGMCAFAALLLWTFHNDPAVASTPWVKWWLLLPLCAIAEVFVVHLPTTRNAHTHSFREVPTLLGLAFLTPVGYLAAHLLGAGTALLLHRRQRGIKLAFNLAWFAVEAVLGIAAYRLLLGEASSADPGGWAAALGAALITDLVGAGLVTIAIALEEHEFDFPILRESVTTGAIAAAANISLASLVVLLVVKEPRAVPLLGFVLLVIYLAYRGYVTLSVRYARLQLLYRFVRSAGMSVEPDDAVRIVVEEARDLMRAEHAELIILPADGQVDRTAWWADAIRGEVALVPSPDGGVAAPVYSREEVVGVLLVSGRTVEVEPFSEEDARLFETLAAHASVALDNAQLVERLRQVAAEREYQALHDALTGLPNRVLLTAQLEAAVAEGEVAIVVLGLDIDAVNEVLGHAAGESLESLVADRLSTRFGDAAARLEGDEFAIMLPGHSADEAATLARGLVASLTEQLRLGDVPVYVTARAGVAAAPGDATDSDVLLRYATAAMHSADSADDPVAPHSVQAIAASERRLALAADLARALADGGPEMWYQPQADAGSREVFGVEALLRWRHPQYSFVPPGELIAVAERTGQLSGLTDFAIRTSLLQRAAWAQDGLDLVVSVNVTARDLQDERLPARIAQRLAETGTPPGRLVVEVTESGVMTDAAQALAVLHEIVELGARVSIDDFGTGHSSLAYLERLPAHELKIDRSFVLRLTEHEADSAVMRSTISLAHELGLHVVAEGVESMLAWELAGALGCDTIQGYVLAPPMPAGDFVKWLNQLRDLELLVTNRSES